MLPFYFIFCAQTEIDRLLSLLPLPHLTLLSPLGLPLFLRLQVTPLSPLAMVILNSCFHVGKKWMPIASKQSISLYRRVSTGRSVHRHKSLLILISNPTPHFALISSLILLSLSAKNPRNLISYCRSSHLSYKISIFGLYSSYSPRLGFHFAFFYP